MGSVRGFGILIGVGFAAVGAAQTVTLNVTQNGQPVGTVRFSVQVTSTGALLQKQLLTLSTGGNTVVFDETSRDDRRAYPLVRTLHVSGARQSADVNIVFSNGVAKVSAKSARGSRTTTIAAPAGADLRIGSDFWFIRDHPAKGTTVRYTQLDVNTLKWRNEVDTYEGDETVSVGGRRMKTHKLQTTSGPQWVDDRGLPVRVELTASKIVMVRR